MDDASQQDIVAYTQSHLESTGSHREPPPWACQVYFCDQNNGHLNPPEFADVIARTTYALRTKNERLAKYLGRLCYMAQDGDLPDLDEINRAREALGWSKLDAPNR